MNKRLMDLERHEGDDKFHFLGKLGHNRLLIFRCSSA